MNKSPLPLPLSLMIRLVLAAVLMLAAMTASLSAIAHPVFTNKEQSAFNEAANGHFIKARQMTEEILKDNENSIGANYVLSYIFWEGEGNLTRAMQLMKTAVKLFEDKYCSGGTRIPDAGDLQAWHQRILRDLAQIFAELDQRDNEIAVHEHIAKLYTNGKLTQPAVWALLKLDRFDQAKEIAENTIKSKDTLFVQAAYNDLTAIADAKHHHLEALRASENSLEYSGGKSCVILLNHARSFEIFLNLDKAIEYLLKADAAVETDCVNDPIAELAYIYLIDGAWQRAITSMLTVKKHFVEKRFIVQVEKTHRAIIANILTEMGFAERAWPLMKTVVDSPSRLGFDSILKEQQELSNAITFYAISSDALKRTDEHLQAWISMHPFWFLSADRRSRVKEIMKQRTDIAKSLWTTHQKAFKQSLTLKNLKSLLAPFYVLSPLRFTSVVDILGRRTSEFLLDYQESIITEEEAKFMQPAFNILRAYIAWRDGNSEEALQYIASYSGAHTKRVKLLDNQMRMIQADILRQQGNTKDAYAMFEGIYQSYPALFRHFDVKLPVKFDASLTDTDDSALSGAYEALADSPRFEYENDAPFVISGNHDGKMIQICMSSPMGVRYACSSTDAKSYEDGAEESPPTPEIVNNFMHAVFTPKVDLSQSDLHSLDGAPVQITADRALEELIGTKPQIGDDAPTQSDTDDAK